MVENNKFYYRWVAFALALSLIVSSTGLYSIVAYATETDEKVANESAEEDFNMVTPNTNSEELKTNEEALDGDEDFAEKIVEEGTSDSTEIEQESVIGESRESTIEGTSQNEEANEVTPYSNYRYGNPENDDAVIIGEDIDGNDVYAIYENDLEKIIFMAEDGMNLSIFFAGTIFAEYSLEDLYTLASSGMTLADVEENFSISTDDGGSVKYANYSYGDSFYNGRVIYGIDKDGNDVYYMYTDDIDEIIAMAEDGMDLTNFFKGTVFAGYTLEVLYDIRDAEVTVHETYERYTSVSTDIPDSASEAIIDYLENGSAD